MFRPRFPLPEEVLDIDPGPEWNGYEVVLAAQLELPSGAIAESGGEYLGRDADPVEIVASGTYPFFLLVSSYGDGQGRPALAQLVLDPTATPRRWEDDARFGFSTDAGTGYLSSPEAVPLPASTEYDDEIFWWFFDPELGLCQQFRNSDGHNFVIFDNGFGDGFFPAAAGYDATGNLVAITWFYGWESWVLAGIPGSPPAPVVDLVACREKLVSEGMAYADTAWCPEG